MQTRAGGGRGTGERAGKAVGLAGRSRFMLTDRPYGRGSRLRRAAGRAVCASGPGFAVGRRTPGRVDRPLHRPWAWLAVRGARPWLALRVRPPFWVGPHLALPSGPSLAFPSWERGRRRGPGPRSRCVPWPVPAGRPCRGSSPVCCPPPGLWGGSARLRCCCSLVRRHPRPCCLHGAPLGATGPRPAPGEKHL